MFSLAIIFSQGLNLLFWNVKSLNNLISIWSLKENSINAEFELDLGANQSGERVFRFSRQLVLKTSVENQKCP